MRSSATRRSPLSGVRPGGRAAPTLWCLPRSLLADFAGVPGIGTPDEDITTWVDVERPDRPALEGDACSRVAAPPYDSMTPETRACVPFATDCLLRVDPPWTGGESSVTGFPPDVGSALRHQRAQLQVELLVKRHRADDGVVTRIESSTCWRSISPVSVSIQTSVVTVPSEPREKPSSHSAWNASRVAPSIVYGSMPTIRAVRVDVRSVFPHELVQIDMPGGGIHHVSLSHTNAVS